MRVSDMIIETLEEVRRKTGERYVAGFRNRELVIHGLGTNDVVYSFDTRNTTATSNQFTLNNLVTRVQVIGKQDNDGRAPIEATVEGDMRFGVLQEIVRRDGDKTLADATAEAQSILDERGKPEKITQITVPDVPFLQKGDLIDVRAGNLVDWFHIEGISHSATTREMTMMLLRVPRKG